MFWWPSPNWPLPLGCASPWHPLWTLLAWQRRCHKWEVDGCRTNISSETKLFPSSCLLSFFCSLLFKHTFAKKKKSKEKKKMLLLQSPYWNKAQNNKNTREIKPRSEGVCVCTWGTTQRRRETIIIRCSFLYLFCMQTFRRRGICPNSGGQQPVGIRSTIYMYTWQMWIK